ncbi:hypothetical protein ACVXG7_13255 [Enterobacter hormaechei]
MVFSQPSAGAERAVPHHWAWIAPGMSCLILDGCCSRAALSAQARYSLAQGRGVCRRPDHEAGCWAARMSIAYVTNRSQIDGAKARLRLPPDRISHWSSACTRCLNSRKHWPLCSTVLSMACWYEQGG